MHPTVPPKPDAQRAQPANPVTLNRIPLRLLTVSVGMTAATLICFGWSTHWTAGITPQMAMTFVAMTCLLAGWVAILHRVRRWYAALVETNASLSRQAQELAELNRSLDDRVAERTRELEASRTAAFNMMAVTEEAKRKLEQAHQALLLEVAERMRIEEAATRFAAIVESSGDAICSKDLRGIVTSWNHGAERLYGYAAGEIIGSPVSVIVPRDRLGEVAHILERIKLGQRIEHFETVRVRKDGTPIDVSATISPIKDAEGTIVGASSIARDITARKRAERELASKLKELELLNKVMVGREERILELKAEVKALRAQPSSAGSDQLTQARRA